jgi:hypothetical protein
MGEIADEIIDRMIFGGGWSSKPRRKTFQSGTGRFMWNSAKGVRPMREMTDEHLRNALRVCEQNGNSGKAKDIRIILQERQDSSS